MNIKRKEKYTLDKYRHLANAFFKDKSFENQGSRISQLLS